jgi:hypothetical protein
MRDWMKANVDNRKVEITFTWLPDDMIIYYISSSVLLIKERMCKHTIHEKYILKL